MLNYFEIIIIGLVLSADSFSAAVAMGARPHKFSDSIKFAFSSGGAEAFVTFIGAMAGAKFIAQFDYLDHWVSFVLLTAVAIHMALEGIEELREDESDKVEDKKFHSFFRVILVSFATSLDAFAVGVTLGAANKTLQPYIFSIGLCAFFSTIIGMGIAKRASSKLGPIFNLIAAFILQGLAVKFLIDGL